MQAALFAALGCAIWSALTGNRTAWLLLASAALCLGLDAAEVEFHFVWWLLIDAAVALLIIRPTMTKADCVILALFIPAWAFYLVPDPHRYTGAMLVAIAQLLLTFPMGKAINRLLARWKANFRHRKEWTDLERRGTNG